MVRLGGNKVMGTLRHDEVEGVVGLGFDVGGRLISGGGSVVKVWEEGLGGGEEGEEDDVREEKGSEDEEGDSSDEEERPKKKRKRGSKGRNVGNGILGFKGLE
jgi:hypothetical protein